MGEKRVVVIGLCGFEELPEQIAMRAGALETDVRVVLFQRVDENPIRLDVAVPASRVIASQRVIQILRRQITPCYEQLDHCLELAQRLSSFSQSFDVLLKLAGSAERPHMPRSS